MSNPQTDDGIFGCKHPGFEARAGVNVKTKDRHACNIAQGILADISFLEVSDYYSVSVLRPARRVLGVSDNVYCFMDGDAIVILPDHVVEGEFDEAILEDLLNQGVPYNQLLARFKEERRNFKKAVNVIGTEAKYAAEHPDEYDAMDDVFDTVEQTKKQACHLADLLLHLVAGAGFEPTTSGL